MALLPLGLLSPGESGTVRDVMGGRHIRSRLGEMGLMPGSKVRVLQNQPCGPLIVTLGDVRLVLGRGVAQKILVEENAS
ncbi:MAG: ferrous iron transport protein A [Bacillota bacterium]